MNTTNHNLRERLLDIEPADPTSLEKLNLEMQTMFDHKLTRAGRLWWVLGLIAAVVFAAYGSLVACLAPLDVSLRIVWFIYTLANLAFVVFAVRILRSGTLNLNRFFRFLHFSPVGALLIAVLLFVRAAINPTMDSLLWAGFGMLCLGVAATWSVYNRVHLAEMSTREQFLRCEYRILQLTERLTGESGDAVS